jgi:hypothetical protein
MACLGGAWTCLCDRIAGGVLVYSADGFVLVKEKRRMTNDEQSNDEVKKTNIAWRYYFLITLNRKKEVVK